VIATEREIEDAGRVFDWARSTAVLHEMRCRARANGLDCLKCCQLDADEFRAQSRYESLLLTTGEQITI
jgi:hypothetical protein